jgi:hypothetical protein
MEIKTEKKEKYPSHARPWVQFPEPEKKNLNLNEIGKFKTNFKY